MLYVKLICKYTRFTQLVLLLNTTKVVLSTVCLEGTFALFFFNF